MPPVAKWLGGFGALPFVALAVVCLVLVSPAREHAALALTGYGALILSFLGGIHWGLAIAETGPRVSSDMFARRLVVSVAPSLIGWIALLVPVTRGLFVLAAGFAVMLAVDVLSSRNGHAPPWYAKLRVPLTIVVVASLLLAAFGYR